MRLGMGLGLGNLLSGQPLTGFPNDFSFNFDGNGDYLDCGASNVLVTGTNVTLSCWFKIDGTSRGYLIQNQKGAGSTNLTIQVNSNDSSETAGYVGAIIWSGAGHDFISVDGNVDDGAWHHLALTTTSSAQVLYLDGTSVATGSTTFTNASSTDSTLIGNDGGSNYDFDGLIDEVAIWDTALSASDVSSIYNNGKVIDLSKSASYGTDRTGNLKLWLRAGDKAEPESTTSIARQDFYTDFDGTNDYVDCGAGVGNELGDDYSGDLTVSAWIKPVTTGGDHGFFNIGDFSSSYGEFVFHLYQNKLYLTLNSNGWRTFTAFTNTDWSHVTAVYKAGSESDTKIYVNGESQSLTGSGTFPSASDMDFNGLKTIIGAYHSTTYAYDGKISNIGIYQTALDAQTISQFAKSRFTPMRDNRFSVVDFDGSNDVIALDSSVSLTGEFTLSAWVKFDAFSVVIWGDSANQNWVRVSSATQVSYKFSGAGSDINHGLTFTTDEWQLITITRNSSNVITVHRNGVAGGTTSSSSNTFTPSIIGRKDASDNHFNGQMSSVSIYNSEKDAYALYQKGITYNESSESGLIGLWRMGDDTSKSYPTIADSSSNSNDGTITNGASDDIVQQMVAGYDLGAFESSSEELGVELSNKDFTGWTLDGSSNWSASSATSLSHTASSAGFASSPFSTVSGKIYKVSITINSGQTNTYKLQLGASSWLVDPTDGNDTWSGNHIFYVSNAGNSSNGFKIYAPSNFIGTFTDVSVKEVLQSEVSDTHPAIIDVNEPVLGVDLVDNLTTSGFADNGDGSTISNITGGVSIADDSGASDMAWFRDSYLLSSDLSVGKTYKVQFNAYRNSSGTPQIRVRDGASNTDISITETDTTYTHYMVAQHATEASIRSINNSSGSIVYLTNLSLEEVQGNVGTMTNQDSADLVYSSVLPDQSFLTGVNSAYNFIDLDGSNEYIDCGDIDTSGNFSFSCWFNADSVTGHHMIFSMSDQSTSDGMSCGFFSGKGGKIYATAKHGDTDSTKATSALSTGQWYHLVVTKSSGQTENIYINGASDTNSADTNWGLADETVIGSRNAGSNFLFNGKISQASVFNKILSATEVSAIYALGRHGNLLDSYSDNLKGYWAMSALDASTGLSDVGDGTIYDRSGNSNHGTATNTESADLKSSPNAEPNGYAKGDTNRSTTTP